MLPALPDVLLLISFSRLTARGGPLFLLLAYIIWCGVIYW